MAARTWGTGPGTPRWTTPTAPRPQRASRCSGGSPADGDRRGGSNTWMRQKYLARQRIAASPGRRQLRAGPGRRPCGSGVGLDQLHEGGDPVAGRTLGDVAVGAERVPRRTGHVDVRPRDAGPDELREEDAGGEHASPRLGLVRDVSDRRVE